VAGIFVGAAGFVKHCPRRPRQPKKIGSPSRVLDEPDVENLPAAARFGEA
jgi:hypothetical protein